jgi:hypothetical protein
MEELELHLKKAEMLGDERAVARMRAYVRDAQMVKKEERSPLQGAALLKWKTPSWVSVTRTGDPNVPVGVNTPRLVDLPDDWARWLWRYPQEVDVRPGIRRARDGMSLLSIRGFLLAAARAPKGAKIQRARHMFLLRAAELVATPGRYRQLVDELRLTIASFPRVMTAQPSDNVTVEDIARLFAVDETTILQVRDAHEWGQLALGRMAVGTDAARRTEAMAAQISARQNASRDEQDRPMPIEPRWWYLPSGGIGTVQAPAVVQQQRLPPTPMAQAIVGPSTTDAGPPVTTSVNRPAAPVAPPDDGVTGWTGMSVVYRSRKKRKSGKGRAARRRANKEAEDCSSGPDPKSETEGATALPYGQSLPTDDDGKTPKEGVPKDVVMEER